MGGKSDAPAAPDYGPMIAMSMMQAQMQARTASEQLSWAKEQWADNKVVIDEVIDQAVGDYQRESRNKQRDRQRYEYVFQPMEEQLAYDAEQYASPERQEYEAGKAQADIAAQMESARQTATDNLISKGVAPGSVRGGAMDLSVELAKAAAGSGAANQARERTQATGRQLRSEAINVGKGYPGQIAGQSAAAQGFGNQAVNVGLAGAASGSNTMGAPTQWSGLSGQSIMNAANTQNMGFNNQMASFNANQQQNSGWGQVAGQAAGSIFSMLPGLEEGGAIPPRYSYADGGMQPEPLPPPPAGNSIGPEHSPSGGAQIDDVDYQVSDGGEAKLNVGEFVFPEDVARWLGEEKLQKMIEKARKDKANAVAQPEIEPDPMDPQEQQAPMEMAEGEGMAVGGYVQDVQDRLYWNGGAIPTRYRS